MSASIVKIGCSIKSGVSRAIGRANNSYVFEIGVYGVVHQHACAVAPEIHVFNQAGREFQSRLFFLFLFNGDECAVVINLSAESRSIRFIASKGCQRCKGDRHGGCASGTIWLLQVLRREGCDSQAILEQGFGIQNQSTACGSRDHIVFNSHAWPLQPESITSMAKVSFFLSGDWFISSAMHADGNVVLKTANLISSFCAESRSCYIVSNIIDEIHVAGMINKTPARIAGYNTATHDSWASCALNSISVKVNRISPTGIGPCS